MRRSRRERRTTTNTWVFVFCGFISASGSVKISENDGAGRQTLEPPVTDHKQMDHRDNQEKSEQMSQLVSKVRHFENVQNDTMIITGKLYVENTTKFLENEEDWQPINIKKKYENNNKFSQTKTESRTSSVLQKIFSKDGSKDLKERNKITESFENRPSYHIIDVGEFSDDFFSNSKESRSIDKENLNLPNHLLEKSARFNIDQELTFPTFETQFFGSFGELSSHKPELHLPPVPESYPAYEHSHQNIHTKPSHKPHPPKREILSSHDHHQVPHLSSPVKPGQDVSALYVDDPWKHIDKVVDSAPPYQPQVLSHQQEPSYHHGTPHVTDPYHQEEPYYQEEQYHQEKPYYQEPYHPEEHYYQESYHHQEEPYHHQDPYHEEPHVTDPYHVDSYEAPYIPPPHYEYSKPNFRPPIKSKPIVQKHHEIVNVPAPVKVHHQEHHGEYQQEHHGGYQQQNQGYHVEHYGGHEYHSGGYRQGHRGHKSLSVLDKYIHPVQHVQHHGPVKTSHQDGHPILDKLPTPGSQHLHSSKPSFYFPEKFLMSYHHKPNISPVSTSVEDPFIYDTRDLGHQTPKKKKVGRLLKFPVSVDFTLDVTEFGAETGPHGAYHWTSSHPVFFQ